MRDPIARTALQIIDDLRLHWHLRKRGHFHGLRPNEIELMQESEREEEALVQRRLRTLLKKSEATVRSRRPVPATPTETKPSAQRTGNRITANLRRPA